jgi:hypothetical protein
MREQMATATLSLEAADRIFNWANTALIVGAVLVAVGTIAAIWSGGIRERYADQRQSDNERQTETAKADAAKANAEAARANQAAEALRQSNLKLEAAAEHERAERLKLEEKVAPRTLSNDQVTAIRARANVVCPQIGRVPVTAAQSNNEAQRFGSEFVQIFKDAGCASDLALPIPGLEPTVMGIHIGVRDIRHIPEQARLLGTVLDAGQVPYDYAPAAPDFFTGEQWVLIVGGKPLPGAH